MFTFNFSILYHFFFSPDKEAITCIFHHDHSNSLLLDYFCTYHKKLTIQNNFQKALESLPFLLRIHIYPLHPESIWSVLVPGEFWKHLYGKINFDFKYITLECTGLHFQASESSLSMNPSLSTVYSCWWDCQEDLSLHILCNLWTLTFLLNSTIC